MDKRLKILVSNDDGYDATGIRTLTAELEKIADVFVSAPLKNHSGASSSLTIVETITASFSGNLAVVHGTPTDCVQIALHADGVLPWKPDLTVTGINMGSNLADDTIYSGTVAAAAESSQLGVPSIAFSLANLTEDAFPPQHFEAAARVAADLVVRLYPRLVEHPSMMINVNIPDLPADKIGAPRVCRLGRRHPGRPVNELEPNGSAHIRQFKFGINEQILDGNVGTDLDAIYSGHVSITPLVFDLTDAERLAQVGDWLQ